MKKFTLICALLCTIVGFAQFPEKDPLLLKGHKIKVEELTPEVMAIRSKNGDDYENFFADKTKGTRYKGKYKTPVSALNGREFTVTDVTIENHKVFGPQYWFELTDGKETLYYKWDKKNLFYMPFAPTDMDYAPEYWDNYITMSADGVSYTAEKAQMFTLDKLVVGGKASYTLYLYTNYVPDCTTQKGMELIFEDGSTLNYAAALVNKAYGMMYLGLETIDLATVKKLGEKKLVKVRFCATETVVYSPEIFQHVMQRCYLKK